MSLHEDTWFRRNVQSASQPRLILYGVLALTSVVVIILLATLLPGDSTSLPTHEPQHGEKPHEKMGHELLKDVPLIDGYNDLIWDINAKLKGSINFPFAEDLSTKTEYSWCKTDLKRLQTGLVGCQMWIVRAPCTSQYKDAVTKTLGQIDLLTRLLNAYKSQMALITNSNSIDGAFKENKIGSLMGIDGGHSIDNKLSVLRLYYNLGVRMISLNSECDTPWSISYASESKSTTSLSAFGVSVIKEINRIGMIIDLANSMSTTQLAVLNQSAAPVILSSTAVFNLHNFKRNVKDEVLKEIKKNNGLVMVSFNQELYNPSSTTPNYEPSLTDVISQINYIKNLIGVDHVGIGSGFSASKKTVAGLSDCSMYPSLFDRLTQPVYKEPKWEEEEIKKLAGLNFLRVFKAVEDVRDKLMETEAVHEELIPDADIPQNQKSCYT